MNMNNQVISLKMDGLSLNFVKLIVGFLMLWMWAPLLSGCQDKRMPDLILIPDGYVGWVRINCNITNAAPIKVVNGYRIFQIPSKGMLSTSSSMQAGWAKDRYVYQAGNVHKPLKRTLKGGGGMIWQVTTGNSNGQEYRKFFVGPERAWRATVQSTTPTASHGMVSKES